MSDDQMREWIDAASYEELLRKWRYAPSGDPFFTGEIGEHFTKVMRQRRDEVGEAAHVAASKRIGWSAQ